MGNFKKLSLHFNKTIRIRYLLLIFIIGIMISLVIGFLWGVDTTAREVSKLAKGFLNITIDKGLIEQAIYQYKNQIGNCFPPKL